MKPLLIKWAVTCFGVFLLLLLLVWLCRDEGFATTDDEGETTYEALPYREFMAFSVLLIGGPWLAVSAFLGALGFFHLFQRRLSGRERRASAVVVALVVPGVIWCCMAVSKL